MMFFVWKPVFNVFSICYIFCTQAPSLTFEQMLGKQKLSKEEASRKIKHFCAYQERCHQEVKEKLYSFGLYSKEVNEIIAEIIEENYLNEERFAKLFAGGRFRIKQWGKNKIVYELKQKGVSSYNIKHALKEIDETDYAKVLNKLANTKWVSLKGQHYLSKMAKTSAYLMQKGYEPTLINAIVQSFRSKEKSKEP